MKRRQTILTLMATLFGAVRSTAHQATTQARVLARHALTRQLSGMEATLVEVTIPPGSGSAAHRHPGFILGYVLEGEMRFGVKGSPEEVVKTSGTFFEPEGAIHTTSASARPDAPVKLLAFMVSKQGSPITLPQ